MHVAEHRDRPRRFQGPTERVVLFYDERSLASPTAFVALRPTSWLALQRSGVVTAAIRTARASAEHALAPRCAPLPIRRLAHRRAVLTPPSGTARGRTVPLLGRDA